MRVSRWISTFASLRSQGVFGSFVGAVVMSLAAVFLLAASAPAANLTWSQASGNWDKTSNNWTGATTTWVDGNTAVFGGTASSTITLTEPISSAGLISSMSPAIPSPEPVATLSRLRQARSQSTTDFPPRLVRRLLEPYRLFSTATV